MLAFIEATVVNGAAKSLLNFCDTASPSEAQIAIATFHRGKVEPGVPANAFVQTVQERGLPTFVLPERRALDAAVLRGIRQAVQQFRPDLVITNNVKSHFLLRLSGVVRRVPWVAFHHGYTATDFKVKLYNHLDRVSLPAADGIVAVCGPFRDQLTRIGVPAPKITVLHNSAGPHAALAEQEIARIRDKFGVRPESKVLVAIGRLSFEKGHADLLTALAHLQRNEPGLNWHLLVVGSGPEQPNVEKQSRELGLASNVSFVGQQSDVGPFLDAADCMVLPSHSEGSPHVVLEAMAAGTPIVATRVGGVPEILKDNETAVLTAPRDPVDLARGIAQILTDPEAARRVAEAARSELQVHYSHEAYKNNLIDMLQRVRSSSRKPGVRT